MQNIKRMCAGLELCPEDVLHKSTLVMKVYRDVVWVTAHRADIIKDEALAFAGGGELDVALTYLMEFAPSERRQDFEMKVTGLFETKWMVDLVDASIMRVMDYPANGKIYYEILTKSYMSDVRYTESELLAAFHLERSTFYERKKEATMLLGVALWGFAIPEIINALQKPSTPT